MITAAHRAQLFQNAEQHRAFERDGYVVLDFFTADEIAAMKALFQELRPEELKGFYTTTFDNSPEYRTAVDLGLRNIFQRPVEHYFEHFKYFFSSFIVKAPGPKSELILHQDMTLVDEAKFAGMNIWAPLIDLTMENGPLYVLPGSHRLMPSYRGSSLPDVYDGISKEVISVMTPLLLRAGQAVAFDQSIMHYSPANVSERERIVVNTFISNEEAQIRICWHDKENAPDKVEIFAQADDFLRHYTNFGTDIFSRPSIGQSLGYFDYDFPRVTLAQLEAQYGKTEVGRLPRPSQVLPAPPIFLNRDLQAQFETEGFVQIDLLRAEDIAALRDLYAQYFPDSPQAFHSSSYLHDFELKKEMSRYMQAIIFPRLETVFHNFSSFGSAFLSKNIGTSSTMPMHQDWTIVDETKYVAVNIWTPLQDADAHNGGLQVLRGSHRFWPVLRCPTIPFFYEEYKAEMQASLTQLDVRAGQAIVLNQALIHASPPNMSDRVRLAITTGIKTAGAPMRFHFVPEPGWLETFAMDEDFLLRFDDFYKDIYLRPQFGESLGRTAFIQAKPPREMILEKIKAAAPQRETVLQPIAAQPVRNGFWRRLFGG
jgi:ectoine hydroxylase-related dioxygenase (phytanoyl-CoA dioxygenase family)